MSSAKCVNCQIYPTFSEVYTGDPLPGLRPCPDSLALSPPSAGRLQENSGPFRLRHFGRAMSVGPIIKTVKNISNSKLHITVLSTV